MRVFVGLVGCVHNPGLRFIRKFNCIVRICLGHVGCVHHPGVRCVLGVRVCPPRHHLPHPRRRSPAGR